MKFKKFNFALEVVHQIKNGEWFPVYNPLTECCCTAYREKETLWITNGPFFCDIEERNVFGYLMRHYVWWAGVRKLAKHGNKIKLGYSDLPENPL